MLQSFVMAKHAGCGKQQANTIPSAVHQPLNLLQIQKAVQVQQTSAVDTRER
jgi:hypothetical protein